MGEVAAPGPPPPELSRTRVTFTVVGDSIPGDPEMEESVAPFRAAMDEKINEVIGRAQVTLTSGRPEGTLGNFAADALLWGARREVSEPVHLSLMNNGGLRIPLARGPITVEKMFELMPFENMVSILTLTGAQVVELARDIAARGGEPVAGFTFRIEEEGGRRVAREVRIAGVAPDPRGRYRLATNDYLAAGGDDMPTLTKAQARRDLPVLVRDVFIDYLRERGEVTAEIEGRITQGGDR